MHNSPSPSRRFEESPEPPIELEGTATFGTRRSVDSLRRDIDDAIRTANQMNHSVDYDARRASAATLGTVNSANSLITRSSYIDFDAKARGLPHSKSARYKRRAQEIKRHLSQKSQTAGSRILKPLEFMTRPFTAIKRAWIRRHTLPPTAAGRKIPIDFMDPPQQIDERTGKKYISNVITSSIYTLYDFVPRQLLVQFSKMANLYFLFVAILQMIPSWSATGNYTTIVPLCIFVLISMGREGYEDINRHRNDKEENNRKVLVARGSMEGNGGIDYETKLWKDVQVGDVVRVLQNEWIPADIILLHSSGPKGQCAIETVALDGETTLKSKEVPKAVQEAFRVENIDQTRAEVVVEDPNLDLFNLEGTFQLLNNEELHTSVVPLGPANIVYRGSSLRNTASVLGLVVFSGMETKMQMNASKNSRSKSPKLQAKVNRIVLLLAAFVLLLSGFSTLVAQHMQNSHASWYFDGIHVTTTQNMMGFIIMFNTLIPLSLYVSMEICKVFQKFLMQSDVDMYDEVNDVRAKVLTASLNEELGQVSYVFSDKTGTLTDNIMLFRKLTVAGHSFIHDLDLYFDQEDEDEGYLFHKAHAMDPDQLNEKQVELLEQLARLPRRSFGGRIGGHAAYQAGRKSMGRPSLGRPSLGRPSMGHPSIGRPSTGRFTMDPNSHFDDSATPRKSGLSAVQWQSTAVPLKPQHMQSTLAMLEYMMTHPTAAFTQRAKFFLLALGLCHSASPEVDLNREDDGEVEIEKLDYQAASPDELALVAAARDLGYLVIDRQYDSITLRTYPRGFDAAPTDEVYKVLDTIEFTSSRKRMSIVIQFPDDRIMLFSKGADSVMIERLHKPLLSTAHDTKQSLHADSQVRRSVEARLANENRAYSTGVRPSIDMILQRRSADLNIMEAGRRSMQLHRQSEDHGAPISAPLAPQRSNAMSSGRNAGASHGAMSPSERRSLQSAVADAAATASSNAAKTRASIELSRANSTTSPIIKSPRASMMPPPPTPPTTKPREQVEIEELDERQTLAKTLEKIDEFSTEGLRTLLYCHRSLSKQEYNEWKKEYDEAKASINNRQAKVDEVGEKLEQGFLVTGATAIEDKLQKGVPETIDKLRRANIRLWMLTGDKQETAVNIGFSCRLIKDYSTIITLRHDENIEAKVMAALEELDSNNIAHCVVVVDGQTLALIEKDAVLLSLFVDLGLRADSAIVCRASPAQKATIVKNVRRREPSKTMLAIGDGANDIAMIQSADVGVGIAGREGLQAARSADFSIGQFRFLLKLLLVHGRWNYVRTCKYILSTFYKEFMFYMGQLIYQRYTLFTGTSIYESWSISMFNTLFTSLPVICVGVFDQDLSPTTLIAVPELYHIGPENREFSFMLFIKWTVMAMLECVLASFLAYQFYGFNEIVRDNTIFPLGVTVYLSIVAIVNLKVQFISMFSYITMISVAVVLISIGGYLLFNILIGLVYLISPAKAYFAGREFWTELGIELSFWATAFLSTVIAYLFEFSLLIMGSALYPTDTQEFEVMEKDFYLMRRLETESELELHNGWAYQDAMDHSWKAMFRWKWPGQPRISEPRSRETRRKMELFAEKLRLRKPHNMDQEIQEIIERRQRETEGILPEEV